MDKRREVSADRREAMIAEAAYFRAERRGFGDGDPVTDWTEAEMEIDMKLREEVGRRYLGSLEDRLKKARKELRSVTGKLDELKTGARKEWREDMQKLKNLHDALQSKMEELEERGEQATEQVKHQAEKIWDDLSDAMQRTARWRKRLRNRK